MFIWRSTGVKAIADALAIWADYESRRRDDGSPAAPLQNRNGARSGRAGEPAAGTDPMLKVVATNRNARR